jgi:hypothetical protein
VRSSIKRALAASGAPPALDALEIEHMGNYTIIITIIIRQRATFVRVQVVDNGP